MGPKVVVLLHDSFLPNLFFLPKKNGWCPHMLWTHVVHVMSNIKNKQIIN
jgi:hypothetical protein